MSSEFVFVFRHKKCYPPCRRNAMTSDSDPIPCQIFIPEPANIETPLHLTSCFQKTCSAITIEVRHEWSQMGPKPVNLNRHRRSISNAVQAVFGFQVEIKCKCTWPQIHEMAYSCYLPRCNIYHLTRLEPIYCKIAQKHTKTTHTHTNPPKTRIIQTTTPHPSPKNSKRTVQGIVLFTICCITATHQIANKNKNNKHKKNKNNQQSTNNITAYNSK